MCVEVFGEVLQGLLIGTPPRVELLDPHLEFPKRDSTEGEPVRAARLSSEHHPGILENADVLVDRRE